VVIGSQRNDDVVNQSKVVGNWDEDHLHVKFGLQYVDEIQTLNNVGDFNNGNWQYAAGYGPASGSTNPHSVMIPAQFFTGGFSTGDFIPGFAGNGNLPATIPTYNGTAVFNYEESLAGAAGCDPRVCGPFLMQLVPGSSQKIAEGTLAEFVTFNTDMQLAGRTLTMNLGVRDEETHLDSSGLSQLPTGLSLEPNDHTAFNVTYTPVQAVKVKNKYQYLLPNLDFNYDLMDDVKLRLDVSRTLTRPPITDLSPDLNVGAGQRVNALNATGNNPDLLPYLSDNVDLGAEWYYSKNSYAAIDVFQKDVTNFVVGGTVVEPINGVMDPTTGSLAQFHVTSQVNGPSATVQGVELAWQHVFGDTGFGYQANATIVDTNKPYERHNITTSGFAVTGIGNSANFTGFYDKNGFQARIAATWRGSFLQSFGQNQNNSAFGTEPTYVNSALNIDFTSSYDIRKNVTIYIEGTNLTNQTLSTHGRFNDQILDLYDYGSRWLLGVRYHY
jgi:TonB-dependent receptor